MKKKLVYLSVALCLSLGLIACSDGEPESATTSSNTTVSDTVDKSDTTGTEAPSGTKQEATTQEETTTEPEKIYDVYVNGVGYDKGVTLEVIATIKAPDTQFRSCCPSFDIYIEGVTDISTYYSYIDFDDSNDYRNPLVVCDVSSCKEYSDHIGYWGYYNLLSLWDNPDGEPMDITNGLHLISPRITFKEAGKYTVKVSSGNGAPEMKETFAKYDNCFFVELKEVK